MEKVSCGLRRISCTFRGSEGDVAFFPPFPPESSSPKSQNRIQRLSSTSAMNPFFFVTLLAKNWLRDDEVKVCLGWRWIGLTTS